MMGSFEEGRVCLRKNMEMTRENFGGEEKKWRWRVWERRPWRRRAEVEVMRCGTCWRGKSMGRMVCKGGGKGERRCGQSVEKETLVAIGMGLMACVLTM